MRRTGLRFAPPRLAPEILPDLAWMLARAFGPDEPGSRVRPAEPRRAVDLARRFGLAARIAARAERAALTAELGDAAEALQAERRVTTAGDLRLEAAVREIAGVAADRGIPIGYLKYAALELAGVLAPGGRGASDVDVLAPAGREEELRDALAAAGFAICDSPGYEHQLAPQIHPRLGAVEVHRIILGVRLSGGSGGFSGSSHRRSATLDALLDAGLTVTCAGLPGAAVLPSLDVLAAHAAVHGLGQHGFEPNAYPALRTFADLIDLGWAGPGGRECAARIAPWLAEDLSEAEIGALVDLCAELAAGTARPDDDGPASLLLRHAIAGRLDPGYANALKLSLLAPRPSERTPLARKLAALAAALWPSAAQLDAIYGRSSSPWGRLGRRLFRPVDLLRRAARAAASARDLDRRDDEREG
ncbi:MAG: nucleotidyltransferase family protein [Acidobacteriota bacterium]